MQLAGWRERGDANLKAHATFGAQAQTICDHQAAAIVKSDWLRNALTLAASLSVALLARFPVRTRGVLFPDVTLKEPDDNTCFSASVTCNRSATAARFGSSGGPEDQQSHPAEEELTTHLVLP